MSSVVWATQALAICPSASQIETLFGCSSPTATCVIGSNVTIDDGCVLEFGNHPLLITTNATVSIGSGNVRIRAARLTIGTGGSIDGRGTGTTFPSNRGGFIFIETTGDVLLQTNLSINVSGNASGGEIVIEAGGTVTVAGRLVSSNIGNTAGGGGITIRAGGDLRTSAAIQATGGLEFCGGSVDLFAGGSIDVDGDVDVSGNDAGRIDITGNQDVSVQRLLAVGIGDAGEGGCIDIDGETGVSINSLARADGTRGEDGFGGCGGFVCMIANYGDLTIESTAQVTANGGVSDGGGGEIELASRGRMTINGQVQARGPQGETCGGGLCLSTDSDFVLGLGGVVDFSGGDAGGDFDLQAATDITVNGTIDGRGRAAGAFGGFAFLGAGTFGTGNLLVQGTIDMRGGICGNELGCGVGGILELTTCDLTVSGSAALLASGASGGQIIITTRDQLTALGTVNATRTNQAELNGQIFVTHPASNPPVVNTFMPPPSLMALPTCATAEQRGCLSPCPVCGNDTVEFPEMCDPPSCEEGCSAVCETQNCDDGLFCTIDQCDVQLGCRNLPLSMCVEGTPTSTPTQTPTRTPTGTPTPSPTHTVTPTVTPTSSFSATPTHTTTPTVTSAPACTGDCNGDGEVSVDEIVAAAQRALGQSGDCTAADANQDGAVTIDELVAIVGNALEGCAGGTAS